MAHHHHDHSACIALAWFSETEWLKLKSIAADAANLDASYEDWLDGMLNLERNLHDKGLHAHRIPLEVDTLARWCTARKRPLDSDSRAAYAAAVAQRSNLG